MKPGADAFIDTNILVYAIDSESRYYQATRNALEREGLAYAVSPQIVFPPNNHIPLVLTINVKDFEAFGITAMQP